MSDRIVVVYERVSTDQQDISRQAVQRERAAAGHPEAELRVIQDDGVSAYKVPIFDRPGGRALCGLIGAGGVQALYVDAQDRLSRGRLAEWVNFKALCDDNGTRIVINGRELKADDETDEMMAAFEAMRARRESSEKSHRVKSGMAHAARQGRANGGPRRYGFDQQDGRLIARPDEIAVVERIMREAVAGRSQTEIAADLNRDGYRTAQGKEWGQTRISQMLANPIWGGIVRNAEGDHPMYEPFVPAELWEAVQKTLRGPEGPRPGRHTRRFLLGNGLLRCGCCGSAMIVRRDRKDYGWYEAYICSGRSAGTHPDCTQKAVQRATVDGAVLAYFERVGLDVEATRAELSARADHERAEIGTLRRQAERELAKVQAGLDKVERDYTLGDLPAADYTRFRTRLEEERGAAAGALARLAAREAQVQDEGGVLEDVELLGRLAELRAAIAGDVTADTEDFAATCAALRRVFAAFHLRAVRGLHGVPVDVWDEGITENVPTAAGGYVLVPEPRSDAVVLSGATVTVQPVPLGLRQKSPASTVAGSNGSAR
jgi:DNA invertase Pin-like site-specific DNA recombinase